MTEEIDCRKCQRDCPGKEDYAPKDIRFCREQMMWLIRNLESIRENVWPISETTPLVQSSRSSQADFEECSIIVAEVDKSLEALPQDPREALLDEIEEWGEKVTIDYLSRPARKALNYISGSWTRRQSYREWKMQGVYRGKR